MTSKQYLDEFVVPHVLKALNVLNEKVTLDLKFTFSASTRHDLFDTFLSFQRPEDPIRFLGQYFTDYQAERVKDEPGSPEGSEENGNAMEEGTV